jgi:hypothetical protein
MILNSCCSPPIPNNFSETQREQPKPTPPHQQPKIFFVFQKNKRQKNMIQNVLFFLSSVFLKPKHMISIQFFDAKTKNELCFHFFEGKKKVSLKK